MQKRFFVAIFTTTKPITMKKYFPFLIVALFIIATAATNEAQKSFATVNKENGYLIFTDCKPNNDYKTLGVLNAKTVAIDLKSLNPDALSYEQLKADVFKQLTKDKEKKFANADGLIFYPDQQKAEVIILQ